ncbi:MAG: aspartate aminotransferase family protein, partial [Thermomicrobiales bacterium]
FVRDRATKAPFPPAIGLSKQIGAATLARGLISYPGAGTVDGQNGDHILYAPPLTISAGQVDELVNILDDSLMEVEGRLAAV